MLSLEIDESWEPGNLGMALIVVDPTTGETLQAVSTSLDTIFRI
jgi:hypothetical protein